MLCIYIDSFNFLPYTVHLNYQSTLLQPADEMMIVLIGPMTIFAIFALFVFLVLILRLLSTKFPDIFCKLVLMLGIQAFFNPIFLMLVDLAQGVSYYY